MLSAFFVCDSTGSFFLGCFLISGVGGDSGARIFLYVSGFYYLLVFADLGVYFFPGSFF